MPLLSHSRNLITGLAILVLAPTAALAGAQPKSHGAMTGRGSMHTEEMASGQSGGGHGNMSHTVQQGKPSGSNDAATAMPTEPGQGAFATIAEIVALLTRDPKTNWSKVDIGRLREHLVDMDQVTLRAKVATAVSPDRIEFTITGKGRTLQAIQAMVPAHSAVLNRTTAWNVKAKLTPRGAVMSLSSKAPQALAVIKALGFFGVMATGAHHQAHHLAMAKGDSLAHAHN